MPSCGSTAVACRTWSGALRQIWTSGRAGSCVICWWRGRLDVYVAYGDPVQWVIGRNLHRRHLTALQRSSCVSAALEWAKQGKQQVMHTERDNSGQFSPIPAKLASIGESDSGQAGQPSFFTQDERATLADVSGRTQQRSDAYETAGLGPKVRSGAISGAEGSGPESSQAAVPTPATGDETRGKGPGVSNRTLAHHRLPATRSA